MKVFLSWSGNRSRAIAEILKGWLPSVLQAAKPYFSPDDVTKGARWLAEISKELEESRIALLVITPENQEAPWLLFEAGALSKNFDRSRVCPLLFDGMEPTDVKGPLVQFQGAKFCKAEMKKVLKAVNTELGEQALSHEVLESVFEMWWPKLEEQVVAQLSKVDESDGATKRSDRELLEEVLALARTTAAMGRVRPLDASPAAYEDLVEACIELADMVHMYAPDESAVQLIGRLYGPLEHIIRRTKGLGPGRTPRLRDSLRRIRDHVEHTSHLRAALEAVPITMAQREPVEES